MTSDDRLFHVLKILQLKIFFTSHDTWCLPAKRELVLVECIDWYVPSSEEQHSALKSHA